MIFEKPQNDGRWNSTFFDTVGDESGSIEMNVDGSVTPVDFKITAPSDKTCFLHRFGGKVEDVGTFDTNTFGALASLTNGLNLYEIDEFGTERLMTTQHPIRDNTDWGCYAFEVSMFRGLTPATGPQCLMWSFDIVSDGCPFILQPGHSLCWRVADDISGLSSFHIRAGMVCVPLKYSRF